MTAAGDAVVVGRAKAHPVARGLGITGIVLGVLAVLLPTGLVLFSLLPGQMNMLWFLFFLIPVVLFLTAIGFVLSLVGVIVGFVARRGTPVIAIVGAVLDVLLLALALFASTGGFSSY